MEEKMCLDCKVTKPLSEFHKNKLRKDGLCYYCKPCNSAKSSKYLKDNPEKAKAYRRKKKLSEYGLTPESFDEMLKGQGGGCAICSKVVAVFNVDHCHDTGKVRGILCPQCNKGLGLFYDDPEVIKRAAEYLG